MFDSAALLQAIEATSSIITLLVIGFGLGLIAGISLSDAVSPKKR